MSKYPGWTQQRQLVFLKSWAKADVHWTQSS